MYVQIIANIYCNQHLSLGVSAVIHKNNKKPYTRYWLTIRNKNLLKETWYKETKIKPLNEIESILDATVLAIWICDDGYKKSPTETCFTESDVNGLICLLNWKFDLNAHKFDCKKDGKVYNRIALNSRKLEDIIGNTIPSCMRYKIDGKSTTELNWSLWNQFVYNRYSIVNATDCRFKEKCFICVFYFKKH